METKDYVVFGTSAGAITALIFGIFEYRQNRKLLTKLNTSVDRVMDMTDVQVSDIIIESATKNAVEQQVAIQARMAASSIRDDISKDIRNKVTEAVDDLKDDVRSDVKAELEKKAKQVSVNDIRDEVIDQVRSQAERKVDRKLEDVIDAHTEKLEEVTKIYDTINKSIKKVKS